MLYREVYKMVKRAADDQPVYERDYINQATGHKYPAFYDFEDKTQSVGRDNLYNWHDGRTPMKSSFLRKC